MYFSPKNSNPHSPFIFITFQIITLNKKLRLKINSSHATLKSLKPLLAQRFTSDFAHLHLKFMACSHKKSQSDMKNIGKYTPKNKQILDQDVVIGELQYFNKNMMTHKQENDGEINGITSCGYKQTQYTVYVEIQYEGG